LARHYLSTPGKQLAEVWDQLPAAMQTRILGEIRAALRQVPQAAGGQAETAPGKPYKRHVRFERAQVTMLNSARSARVDAAWAGLAETARTIQQGRERR
jgi:hypothetical protein